MELFPLSFQVQTHSAHQLGQDGLSWVLREDGGVWHAGDKIARLLRSVEEGDVIGVAYDHEQLRFLVNGEPAEVTIAGDGRAASGVTGLRGTLYPVVGVSKQAVLDVAFSSRYFHFSPPSADFSEIMLEYRLL